MKFTLYSEKWRFAECFLQIDSCQSPVEMKKHFEVSCSPVPSFLSTSCVSIAFDGGFRSQPYVIGRW